MKRTLLLACCFLLFLVGSVFAQQKILTSQYMLNQYILNPAVGGTSDFIEAVAGYRMQWVGLQGAPRTFYLTVHGPLGKAPAHYNWKNKKNYHHGLGAYLSVDKTGLLSRTLFYGSYSYNMALTRKIRLSTGAFIGFQQYNVNGSKINVDSYDPSLPASGINKIIPDMSLGTWLYSKDFYVGLSLDQILGSRLDYAINKMAQTNGKLVYHYFLTAGYCFPFYYDELEWIPSTMIRYVHAAPPSFDINNKIRYKKMYWAGVSYRYQNAIAILAGVTLFKSLTIGYSYDICISALAQYNSNSHEIVVGYKFKRNYDVWSPQRFW